MSETTVAVLTPTGASAVAVLSVRGPSAWPILTRLFRTADGRQRATPPAAFAYGRIGEQTADEVILGRVGTDSFEVHCHGGPQVVSWLLGLLRANGAADAPAATDNSAARLLSQARTVRTAGILLDQLNGAYNRAERAVLNGGPDAAAVRELLRRNARVGRHLIKPWTVAIAGPPNAGKSTLLNALAGFARSVVSPIPGTTRDALSVTLAFDGWPVEVTDTAGLRQSADELEREGVERARTVVASSDLVLWVLDASALRPRLVAEVAVGLRLLEEQVLMVLNKTDLVDLPAAECPSAVRISAAAGAGLAGLVDRIVSALAPNPPAPGEPVPFTPELCDRWS